MNIVKPKLSNVKYFIVAFVLLGTIIFVALAKNTNQEPSAEIKNPQTIANPHIIVKKRERRLELFDGEKLVKTYNVALGFAPQGDKEKQGDGKTPEGEFYIFTRNPKSKFYLSLGVSYPSVEDAERGLKANLITKREHDLIIKAINAKRTPPQNTALGGEIYIHGGGIGKDWTFGCVALENAEIKELFDIIPVGAKVTILP